MDQPLYKVKLKFQFAFLPYKDTIIRFLLGNADLAPESEAAIILILDLPGMRPLKSQFLIPTQLHNLRCFITSAQID